MDISQIDKNFAVDAQIDKTGLKFYSVDEKPFKIYGVKREGDRYVRLPQAVADTVSSTVSILAKSTSGGRVRFCTDSKRVAVIAKFVETPYQSPHMTYASKTAVDLYDGKRFLGTYMSPMEMPNSAFESLKTFEPGDKNVTLNFPPYGALCQLYVGIDEDAKIWEAPEYTYRKPVVYYGSSITQGGCASRPGTPYPAFLSRWLDCDYVNLGFSGGAKGEANLAEYIAGLDMSVLVIDYDHNAYDPEDLRQTHEPFFKIIREKNPDLPVIFLTRPSVVALGEREERRDVIKATYDHAVAAGDQNVYFHDSSEFFPFDAQEHTVDNCHLTDLGFYLMAKGLEPTLKKALEK